MNHDACESPAIMSCRSGFKQTLHFDFIGEATQLWNESRCGWNKWKWFPLSVFRRSKITMARFSPIYSLQLIKQDSWRTSGLFYETCSQYVLCSRANHWRKGKRYQLVRHGDPYKEISRRWSNGLLSNYLQQRQKTAVWQKIHCPVWFSRTCSAEMQPRIRFISYWICILTEK